MLSKLKKKAESGDFTFFIHFFSVFTGIFLVMTVIILQVMRVGVYSSVDSNLQGAVANAEAYVSMTMSRTLLDELEDAFAGDSSSGGGSDESDFKLKPGTEVAANTSYIVYNSKGIILNNVNTFSGLQSLKLDSSKLGQVKEVAIENYSGHAEKYHTITVAVSSEDYPEVAYITIAINTTQLGDANSRYIKIIVVVMVIFWIISVLASVYLAKWSRKPILENYEKQKTFVENASHELRTPLAVLQNRLETLFRKPESTILENSENIASSLDEVRNMRILTTNLLNLARRDDGLTPEIKELSPEFFDDLFDSYSLIAEENHKVFTGINKVTRTVKTDETLLKQLLTILFDNAVKYTGQDGKIILTIRQSPDRHLLIQIADNGLGISDEDKKKIFDRFYRVDKARTRQSGGFGLGLSLAKQIVDSLKGTITVKDNPPQGTIFEVKL
ncbi:sensor histidine kinase [Streptococcus chenjunshii]|uniref:histidine kinase n=1 Tax=Streptococcus chenjunshii TaxID=2173853 RepID=A0A372KP00_9STRE|nr:HAMP domain-containing sensor histidine kinase [Streptococcus chenjunshii]AXQ78726.1 sensor histidine kinase [Streptococcus chenjunshii]RFU51681.1 sensor histidine kinase [Streptococcus chenjunshii]RFU54002.1 sensor histidine kinase [Streptococcus chenjunshii]